HGSLRDPIWEYVFNQPQADATLRIAKTTHGCNGHTHVPVAYREGQAVRPKVGPDVTIPLTGRCLVNPGTVGHPPAGASRPSYALVDTDAATVTFQRAAYDVRETQNRIRARGLPSFLAERLALGH